MDKTRTAFDNNSHNNVNTCKQNNISKIKSTVSIILYNKYTGAQSLLTGNRWVHFDGQQNNTICIRSLQS